MPTTLISPVTAEPIPAAKRHANNILNSMSRLAKTLVDTHQQIYKETWHSTDATPQEIFNSLGSNGVNLLLRGGDLVVFLLGAQTGRPICIMDPAEYTPPVNYSVNVDGSITLG